MICTFTWEIRSILEGQFLFSISVTFSEEVLKWSENVYDCSCTSCLVCVVWFIWGVSAIVSRSLTVWPLLWRRFFMGVLACPSVPYDERGYKILRGDFFYLSQGIFSLPSLSQYLGGIDSFLGCLKGSLFSWGLSKYLGGTDPQLQATSRRVRTFPPDFLVSWRRRCQWNI